MKQIGKGNKTTLRWRMRTAKNKHCPAEVFRKEFTEYGKQLIFDFYGGLLLWTTGLRHTESLHLHVQLVHSIRCTCRSKT